MTRLALPLAAALALAAIACGPRPPSPPPPPPSPSPSLRPEVVVAPIRAMTFNIRYGTAPDAEHAWPLRRELAFHLIGDFAPDVLGVQEALRFQLDEIRHALPHYGEVGVGREDGREEGEYSAILYDRRRLDLLDHGTFWLSDTPELPGSRSWGNRFPRVVTWARFRHRHAGLTFHVFNTHWDHESQPARLNSAALLLERIRDRAVPDDPVLVMGDFNAGEDNPAFQALLATPEPGRPPLYDTFRAVHPHARLTGTYHAFTGDRDSDKIDAILASPRWETLDAEIVLFNHDGLYPSDHFPVTATLRLHAPPSPAPRP
jgi:endonuclease/exonuclease/phosphatase family metal-dependent hydrolase